MPISQTARRLLHGFDLEELEASPNTCLAVGADFTIIYINPAYIRFADNNDGRDVVQRFGIGTDFLEAIRGPQQAFYRGLLTDGMNSGEQRSHDYECSSPDEFRKFRLLMYPSQDRRATLMEHSLLVNRPHDREMARTVLGEYLDQAGLLHQCGHCRRVRHLATGRWDWCPPLMDYKDTSHGLCQTCLDFHYPDLADRDVG